MGEKRTAMETSAQQMPLWLLPVIARMATRELTLIAHTFAWCFFLPRGMPGVLSMNTAKLMVSLSSLCCKLHVGLKLFLGCRASCRKLVQQGTMLRLPCMSIHT